MSNPTELPDLDACPFCGGTEAFVERADYSSAFVVCDSRVDEHSVCMARGPIGIQDDDGEEIPGQAAAIREWNKAAAVFRRAQPEGEAPQAEKWRHAANEWADTAYNGLQHLRNIEDGITEAKAARENMEKCCQHASAVAEAAATLSPLCGAQHAESGKEAVLAEQAATMLIQRKKIQALEAALAAQQAASPGALDADEMTRLRRLLTALGHADAFELSDEYVRGELCHVLGLAAGKLERAALAAAPSAPGTPEAPKQPAHGHRDDYYLLANGRRLGLESISRVRNMPNWVLAMELFATGSTSAHKICHDAGIDPDSTTTQRTAQLDGGQEGSES